MDEKAAAQDTTPVAARGGRASAQSAIAHLRSVWRLPPGVVLRLASHAGLRPIYATALYRRSLGRATAFDLRHRPHDPWPGDTVRAQAILRGCFRFAGQSLERPDPLWHPPEATPAWRARFHGFDWLRDLRQHNSDAARRWARDLVDDWMAVHPGPGRGAWTPEVAGRRLANWLGQASFFADSAEADFRNRLIESATRQARHLARILPAGLTGAPLLTAIKGLIYAGLCLPDGDPLLRRGMSLLERTLPPQIEMDGVHLSRCPRTHLLVLCDLLDLRATFATVGVDSPRSLVLGIESMTPILKLFRHGDGGLALFNGGDEGNREVVDIALKRAGPRSKTHQAAPESGFYRLEAGKTCLLIDAGAPPPPGFDTRAHAGTLSFELSEGRRRVVTNCGAAAGDTPWREVARATAAHNTVTVAETNSSEVLAAGGLGRRPSSVVCRREEAGGAHLLDMSHDGYSRSHDLRHARRLYLDSEGGDLRGEDVVTGIAGRPVAVRFHLHPDTEAALVQNGTAVLIRLPKGGAWRFQVSGATLDLAESVYLGEPEHVRRAQQIVLTTQTESNRTAVKWAMKRESP